MPWLTVPEPIDTTTSPICSAVESPKGAGVRPAAPLTCTTATSLFASAPATRPVYFWPADVVTVTCCDPATRLAGVTTVPTASISRPLPEAVPASMRTTDGPIWPISRRRSAWIWSSPAGAGGGATAPPPTVIGVGFVACCTSAGVAKRTGNVHDARTRAVPAAASAMLVRARATAPKGTPTTRSLLRVA